MRRRLMNDSLPIRCLHRRDVIQVGDECRRGIYVLDILGAAFPLIDALEVLGLRGSNPAVKNGSLGGRIGFDQNPAAEVMVASTAAPVDDSESSCPR